MRTPLLCDAVHSAVKRAFTRGFRCCLLRPTLHNMGQCGGAWVQTWGPGAGDIAAGEGESMTDEAPDPMPEGLWHVLASAPGSSGEVADLCYASAARYLAGLIREHKKQICSA